MCQSSTSVEDLLNKLPWRRDLSLIHRHQMLGEIVSTMGFVTSRESYAVILNKWAQVAHEDLKKARLQLLRTNGLLSPITR